jgi:transposase
LEVPVKATKYAKECQALRRRYHAAWPEGAAEHPKMAKILSVMDLIVTGQTLKAAAAYYGVHETTVMRWWAQFLDGGYPALCNRYMARYRKDPLPVRPMPLDEMEPLDRPPVIDTKKIGPQKKQALKEAAIRRHQRGETDLKIAKDLNLRRATVHAWVKDFEARGLEALSG